MLIPNTTQIKTTAISIGHSSSAYSFEVIIPRTKVTAADTMMSCQPQKCILPNNLLYISALSNLGIE